jgi:stage V sporulation protein AD
MAGRLVDGGIRDSSNMGAAMAPAAAESILTFLKDSGTRPEDYDHIVTGDLGISGSELLLMLLSDEGVSVGNHLDCGCMLYDCEAQDAHAGASGCGCSAAMLSAHFLPMLERGEKKRILFLSTGAIMSPSSVEQGENIFGIAPAVVFEHA